MKYEYQGIKLGDTIEKIIHLLNNENTKFDDFYSYLIYEPGSTIEDIPTKIFIYLYTGTVVMIQVIDENYCLAEDLRIGTPISKEIIDKRTLTVIRELTEEEKIAEVARMVSGDTMTKLSEEHSIEMLRLAEKTKADIKAKLNK